MRTGPDALIEEIASVATVPVFNMLTAEHHPCQALADLLTLREAFGRLEGLKIAYVGDGNNVARSLALLGAIAGVEVAVASPPGYALTDAPDALLTTDPAEAVAGAHAIYADVWVSMGDEDTADARRDALAPYRIDDALLDLAAPARSRCTACPRTPARRSRPRCSTASASASGIRRRTAATRRRRCWSSCCDDPRRAAQGCPAGADHARGRRRPRLGLRAGRSAPGRDAGRPAPRARRPAGLLDREPMLWSDWPWTLQ